MTFNNFGAHKRNIDFEAKKNYTNYTKSFSSLMELGENTTMLSNIEQMKNKLNKMLEEGKYSNEDAEFSHLNSIFDSAVQIQIKSDKSLNDISAFYTAYNNFNDVHKFYSGDK